MKVKSNLFLSAIIIITIIVFYKIGSAIFDSAVAQNQQKTEYLSIPGEAFLPRFSNQAYGGDAWIRLVPSASSNINQFIAPVYLPQGARIVRFTAWVSDNSPAADISVNIGAIPLKSGPNGMTILYRIGTGGIAGDTSIGGTTSISIDNMSNSYLVQIILPDQMTTLSSVQLVYMTY